MKSKLILGGLIIAGLLLALPAFTLAQEGEPVVVDEVIAQVNDGVITLSQLKREMKERIDTLKQNGMTEQQAADEVEKRKPELIATLINEQLLLQKGKDLDLSDKVEAEVNKRMLDVAKEQKIKTVEQLDEAMRQSGLDPVAIRQTMRVEIMKQAVLESEVDSKIFYGWSGDELRRYFDAHRDKFRKPEVVNLSEIFLSLAGKPEADVKARANQLVTQLRGGADFGKLAASSSERPDAAATKGEVGNFETPNLRPDIAAAIKNVIAGGVSDPLKTDEGYQILRVNSRTPGSDVPTFNENNVREAMTAERAPKEREAYLKSLGDDAYVKIAKDYNDAVMPLLKIKQQTLVEKTADEGDKKPEKKKGKLLGIIPKP